MFFTACRAAKRVKGPKGDKKGGGGNGAGGGSFKSPGQVKQGDAYATETRNIILSLNNVKKQAPNGKQILDKVRVLATSKQGRLAAVIADTLRGRAA